MTLFLSNGIDEEFILPEVTTEISQRELLNWERELIGLYISDHPLNPVMEQLSEIVTHYSSQLSEVNPNEKVRVAGMLTHYRTHFDKKGKMMAFGTLEDIQGETELVIFARAWEKVSKQIMLDQIIVVDGRVDLKGNEPKILVEDITTDLKVTSNLPSIPLSKTKNVPSISPIPDFSSQPPDFEDVEPPSPYSDIASPFIEIPEVEDSYPFTQSSQGSVTVMSVDQPSSGWSEPNDIDHPSPPEILPPGFSLAEAVMGAVADPEKAIKLAHASSSNLTQPESSRAESESVVNNSLENSSILSQPRNSPETVKSPSLQPIILAPDSEEAGEQKRLITIQLYSTGDKTRDQLRIRQIYGTLISNPGRDRFIFHVFENKKGYLIEFPNFTTNISLELLTQIKTFVSADQVRIEPLTIREVT
jgi:DNA polymerase-3 subunit alpha